MYQSSLSCGDQKLQMIDSASMIDSELLFRQKSLLGITEVEKKICYEVELDHCNLVLNSRHDEDTVNSHKI